MTRTAEWALALVALVLTGGFLAGVSGGGVALFGEDPPASRDGRYFHAGKGAPVTVGDRGCRSPGCHAGMPHARDRALAAFRNMHLGFIDCLVCHGKDSRKSWIAEPAPAQEKRPSGDGGPRRKRWTIVTPTPPADREKSHGMLGAALSCRSCHSEEGAREIAAKGAKDLPGGFVNPVALRMVEEGAKQWIPDAMR